MHRRENAVNGAKLRSAVTYAYGTARGDRSDRFRIRFTDKVAAVASTSWYDKNGKIQVRFVVAPIKPSANSSTKSAYFTLMDLNSTSSLEVVERVKAQREQAVRVDLNGKPICLRATLNRSQFSTLVTATTPKFRTWAYNFAPRPSTEISSLSSVRPIRYLHDRLTVVESEELRSLAIRAAAGKIPKE